MKRGNACKVPLSGRNSLFKMALRILSIGLLVFLMGTIGYAEDDYILEDTVITATKTGETQLQKTPIAISAFDEDALSATNSFSIMDLSMYTPNLEMHSVGGVVAGFIRGIGSRNTGVGGEASIAYYVDGVYSERMLNGSSEFMDIERIEILRGPQGTLYGRNATGGAINIITKLPTDELSFATQGELGSFGKRKIDASIAGPLIKDKLKARLTITDSVMDGYADNKIGKDLYDTDYSAARGAVEMTPQKNIDIVIRGDYLESTPLGSPNVNKSSNGLAGVFGFVPPDDFWDVAINHYDEADIENWGLSGTVRIDLPHDTVFRSITAYREWGGTSTSDYDGSSVDLEFFDYETNIKHYSQEFQMDGTIGAWNWLAGLYYYHMEDDALYSANFPAFALFDLPYGGVVEGDAYAAFTNVAYHFTDKLTGTVGLRYSYEEKELEEILAGAPAPLPGESDDWDDLSPKLGIDYQLTDDALVYAIISKGFKSGTFSPFNPASIGFGLEPEILWSYEVGTKTDWLDKRLRANATAFYYDYSDLQVSSYVNGLPAFSNAADATVKGLEFELMARPIAPLTLTANLSYLDTEYEDFLTVDLNNIPVDASGNQFADAPKWKFGLGAQYVLPVGEMGFLMFRGDMSWSDEYFLDVLETEGLKQASYTIVNSQVRFETADSRWSVEVFGKNLGEEETKLSSTYLFGAFGFQDNVVLLGPPRTFGVQVAYNFK